MSKFEHAVTHLYYTSKCVYDKFEREWIRPQRHEILVALKVVEVAGGTITYSKAESITASDRWLITSTGSSKVYELFADKDNNTVWFSW